MTHAIPSRKASLVAALLLVSVAGLSASDASAGTCKRSGSSVEFEAPPISSAPPANCTTKYGLDTSDKSAQSSSAYTNPNSSGGCDLGLEMPGLPKFGFKFDPKINACQILKKVTGEMVEAANKKMQATVDETLGTGMDVDISAQDMAEERAARANRR